MKFLALFLIGFGILLIIFPDFLPILIGSFFVILGINLLFLGFNFSKKSGFMGKKDYVKFGKYKIYR